MSHEEPRLTTGGLPGPPGCIDETLLDVLARPSPEERLRLNDRMVLTIQELRHGFAAEVPRDAAGPAGRERD